MTPARMHDRRATFLAQIEDRQGADLADAFMNEAMETGGRIGSHGDDWAGRVFTIDLHGVHARGATAHEAMRNWVRQAGIATGRGDC